MADNECTRNVARHVSIGHATTPRTICRFPEEEDDDVRRAIMAKYAGETGQTI
jgi:hypothetical protein